MRINYICVSAVTYNLVARYASLWDASWQTHHSTSHPYQEQIKIGGTIEVCGKPVGKCLRRTRTQVHTHARRDGQIENIMPSTARRMGGGDIKRKLIDFLWKLHTTGSWWMTSKGAVFISCFNFYRVVWRHGLAYRYHYCSNVLHYLAWPILLIWCASVLLVHYARQWPCVLVPGAAPGESFSAYSLFASPMSVHYVKMWRLPQNHCIALSPEKDRATATV